VSENGDARRAAATAVLLALSGAVVGCATGATQSGLAGRQQCVECAIVSGPAPESLAGAAERFGDGCRRGQGASCSALGLMHMHGRGVSQDRARATALLERACQLGNTRGCVHLGRLLEDGSAERRDPQGAALMFELGCEQGESEGCYSLAQLRYQQGRTAEAERALEQACDDQYALACTGLGAMVQHGHGVAPNGARARQLYLHACRLGEPSACRRLAGLAATAASGPGGSFGTRQSLDPAASP